jgi:hypothetical protein
LPSLSEARIASRRDAATRYTQTSDVEGEINGLVTYDRREQNLPAERLKELHAPLYEEGDGK